LLLCKSVSIISLIKSEGGGATACVIYRYLSIIIPG
jgi:hypothetical protein